MKKGVETLEDILEAGGGLAFAATILYLFLLLSGLSNYPVGNEHAWATWLGCLALMFVICLFAGELFAFLAGALIFSLFVGLLWFVPRLISWLWNVSVWVQILCFSIGGQLVYISYLIWRKKWKH